MHRLARLTQRRYATRVNALYQPGGTRTKAPREPLQSAPNVECDACACNGAPELVQKHESMRWTPEELRESTNKHVMMTWGPAAAMIDSALHLKKAEGVYMWDQNDKKYLDFNAGAMCANLGHTVPPEVIDAITDQLKTLPYAYPGVSVVDVRTKLAQLLAEITPGDINAFLFPSTGMESNETAIRLARQFTGRRKILTRYRSYHGSSIATLGMTGDYRRAAAESYSSDIKHFFDPNPYSFKWGETEEELVENHLQYVRETIDMEGPETIALITLESVTGTNGILKPPKGYLEGIREICDQHGILLHCDEVMAGFGRTGKLFGWCHSNMVPDLVTAAKGINGAYLPLGMVGMRDHVAEHFRSNPTNIGSTYNSHPVAVASAYACIKYMLKHNIIGQVAEKEKLMVTRLQRLLDNHKSVKQARVVGLFGCFDTQSDTKGTFSRPVNAPLSGEMAEFRKALYDAGMFTFVRGHTVYTNPPLTITEDEINEGFDIIEKCLPILDAHVDG